MRVAAIRTRQIEREGRGVGGVYFPSYSPNDAFWHIASKACGDGVEAGWLAGTLMPGTIRTIDFLIPCLVFSSDVGLDDSLWAGLRGFRDGILVVYKYFHI